MCIALGPSVGTESSFHYVDVETRSELTRGMTVVDRLNVANDERNQPVWSPVVRGAPKAKIFWTIDSKRWKQALFAALQ